MSNVVHINRQRRKRRKKNHGFRYILLSLFVLVILLFLVTKGLKIDTIIVSGNSHYTKEEILKIVGIEEEGSLLSIYLATKKEFSGYPYIENINIIYSDLNKVTIAVEEKKIAGYIPFMDKYICVDKGGYVLDYVSNPDEGFPIIEGIVVQEFVIGEKAELSEKVLQGFLMFYRSKEQYNLSIDKIVFEENKLNNIYLFIDKLKVNFGGLDDFNEKLKRLKNIISEIDTQKNGTLDLKTMTLY